MSEISNLLGMIGSFRLGYKLKSAFNWINLAEFYGWSPNSGTVSSGFDETCT
jgi:hypothetical protein